MIGMPERETIEKGLMTLWIIWAAMAGSLLIYVFVCHQVGEEIRRTASPDFPLGLLKNIFYVAAIGTLFLAQFLRKLMLASRFASSEAEPFKPGAASNHPSFLAKYTTAAIVSLALCESIRIYGLALFFLGDTFRILYTFLGISAIAMFFYRPKGEELEALAIALQTEGEPTPRA